MKENRNSGVSLCFCLILGLAGIAQFFSGFQDELYANSQPAPVSGTPRLHRQRPELLQNLGGISAVSLGQEILNSGDFVGKQLDFHAFNFGNNQYDSPSLISATCQSVTNLSTGYRLNIYVQNGQSVSSTTIRDIQDQFADEILPTMTHYFGNPPLGDFTILIMDIQDDYDPRSNGSTYVSGYFDSENEAGSSPWSNYRHMIYMDSNPGQPGSETFYGSLAHEFQHFVHFGKDPREETWVNEGLSGLARFLCGYGHAISHVTAFADAPGTSLTFWDDTLANYGATYLFMLYLEEHYGGAATVRNIVANAGHGISGMNGALRQSGYAVTVNDIFKNWVIANYMNETSISGGIYGYTAFFDPISTPKAPGNIQMTNSHSTYPALSFGSVNRYAANYIKFSNLGGTYDTFVLIPYSFNEDDNQSYSYTGILGSLRLSINGVNAHLGMSGVQQGASNPIPQIASALCAENSASTSGGVSSNGCSNESGGCFIATAVYGSSSSREVLILKDFRDRYLLTHRIGRGVVILYHTLSPPIADFLSSHKTLRGVFRMALSPIVGFSYALVRHPGETVFVGVGLFLLFGMFLGKKKRS